MIELPTTIGSKIRASVRRWPEVATDGWPWPDPYETVLTLADPYGIDLLIWENDEMGVVEGCFDYIDVLEVLE